MDIVSSFAMLGEGEGGPRAFPGAVLCSRVEEARAVRRFGKELLESNGENFLLDGGVKGGLGGKLEGATIGVYVMPTAACREGSSHGLRAGKYASSSIATTSLSSFDR